MYGKGVIRVVEQYNGTINGEKFADIVGKRFSQLVQDSAQLTLGYFVQDNDLLQNRKKAKDALAKVKAPLT